MERIVLKHTSGSKANQVEEFPLNHFQELNFGRDPLSSVRYDSDRDDLVGRYHAKILRDSADKTVFVIEDLTSRNGTYVNRQRVVGRTRIMPGDMIQFGPGGPEFQFDLDPRPEFLSRTTEQPTESLSGPVMKPTREVTPPTREASISAAPSPRSMPSDSEFMGLLNAVKGSSASAPNVAQSERAGVGKATVERMIGQAKKDTRKQSLLIGAALLVVVLTALGAWVYFKRGDAVTITDKTMNASEITKTYANAVVYIEVGWHLIWTRTGGQIYHKHIKMQQNGRIIKVPTYVLIEDDKLEPELTTNADEGLAIGTEHSGSGFVVTSDGFILTNAHVAASWKSEYFSGDTAPDGVLVDKNGELRLTKDKTPYWISNLSDSLKGSLNRWIPADSKQIDKTFAGGFSGRHDYLDVTFPKNQNRIPARLARVSDKHDVAMLKIELSEPLPKTEMYDNYNLIKPGDTVTVLGYPGASPKIISVTSSREVFARSPQMRILPDPTVAGGNIGRILRGQEAGGNKDAVVSWDVGDSYQLSGNFAGPGNSGGPIFDDHGRVIGILNAGSSRTMNVAFAVPIRYGKELMGINPVLK